MRSEGIIKEVMFSSRFKICFVRIYSLALRLNALLLFNIGVEEWNSRTYG